MGAVSSASGREVDEQARRKFAFLCFNTAFFVSHFRPVVEAARAQGFELIAFLPEEPADDCLQDVTVVRFLGKRTRFPFLRLLPNLYCVALALWRHRPDVVQAFSLQACVVLALAARLVRVRRKIYTVTGLGLIGVDTRWSTRMLRPLLYGLFRAASRGPSSTFIFENTADAKALGLSEPFAARCRLLMGAGVDPAVFVPSPLPPSPPLKIAIVARMIWTKGIDTAVEAVSMLQTRGLPVELDLYGHADQHNPQFFPEATLRRWGQLPGIRWHGHVTDVPSVWRAHHVALFASRGGEGLPRAMLEAAACGRALIATRVPGCVDFVRPDVDGLLVEPNSAEALAGAIETLLRAPKRLAEMGHTARQRLVETATEEIIIAQYAEMFAAIDAGLQTP